MHAAGGIVSTMHDLARWIHIHLNEGRVDGETVFPAEVIREMQILQIYELDQNPLVPDDRRIGWGLGWDVHDDRNGIFYAHSGAYDGWSGIISFTTESDIGLVLLANSTQAEWLSAVLTLELYDHLHGVEQRDLVPKLVSMATAMKNDAPVEPERTGDEGPSRPPEDYVGRYENHDWGGIEVFFQDDRLSARAGDLSLPLDWTGVDAFIADDDQKGHFEVDASGRVVAIHLGSLLPEPDLVRFSRTGDANQSE